MSSYMTLSVGARAAFGVCTLLLMTAALCALAAAWTLRLRRRGRLAAALLAAAGFVLAQSAADAESGAAGLAPLGRLLCGLPWAAAVGLLLTLALALGAAVFFRRRRERLHAGAVKEGLDAMPTGVCFAAPEGTPLLVNVQMDRLCGLLLDRGLLDARAFWDALRAGAFKNGVRLSGLEPAVTVRTADGTVWDFRRSVLDTAQGPVVELIAYDVTEQYRLNRELTARTRRLAAVGARLRLFSREVERVAREKELLAAKIHIHDELGRTLLALRAYLAQPAGSRDRRTILPLWRYVASALETGSVRDGPDDWMAAQEAARAVGVTAECAGALPSNAQQRALLLAAVRECANNAALHAGAARLLLVVRENGAAVSAELTNDGAPPETEVRETGGLKNLRAAVEKAGGVMTVESAPRFVLRIVFRKEEDAGWPKQV